MKTKREHYTKEWGRILSALLALVLAVGLVLAVPALDGPALAAPEGSETADGSENDEAEDNEDPGTPGNTPSAGPAMTLDEALAKAQEDGCSLTLQFPIYGPNVIGSTAGEQAPKPENGDVVVDVYKIADAVKRPGVQTYQFELEKEGNEALFGALYGAIQDGKDGWRKTVSNGVMTFYYESTKDNVRAWTELVDQIARACLKTDNEIHPVVEGHAFGEKAPIEGLAPGLYLTVVRAETIPNPEPNSEEKALYSFIKDSGDQYKDLLNDGKGDPFKSFDYPQYITAQTIIAGDGSHERIPGTAGDFSTDLASIAYNNEYVYYFQPQLISLPGYSNGGVIDGTVNPGSNTGYTGSWQTSVAMVTKYNAKPRYVDLQIVKTLPRYLAGPKSVTFLYRIEATRDGKTVYSTIESISFDGPSTSGEATRVIVDCIPVDCSVTVTEINTGYTYSFKSGSAKSETNPGGHDGSLSMGSPNVNNAAQSVTIPARQLPGSILLNIPDADGGFETVRLDVGDTEIVTFENDLSDENKGGGSVVNIFTAGKDNWTWTKRTYDPATGELIEVDVTPTWEGGQPPVQKKNNT